MGARRCGAPTQKKWGLKISCFFFFLPPRISLLFVSLRVCSRNCGRDSRPWTTQIATFGLLWGHFFVRAPAAYRPPGVTPLREKQRANLSKKSWRAPTIIIIVAGRAPRARCQISCKLGPGQGQGEALGIACAACKIGASAGLGQARGIDCGKGSTHSDEKILTQRNTSTTNFEDRHRGKIPRGNDKLANFGVFQDPIGPPPFTKRRSPPLPPSSAPKLNLIFSCLFVLFFCAQVLLCFFLSFGPSCPRLKKVWLLNPKTLKLKNTCEHFNLGETGAKSR